MTPAERWDILRIRRRHAGYRYLLAMELINLALQPLAHRWAPLNPLMAIAMALLMLLTMTRFSMLRATRMRTMVLGFSAIVLESVWLLLISLGQTLPIWFTALHLAVWILYLGLTTLRLVVNLIHEPYVTISVVMGAASGYLLIGYSGGLLLYSLWLLDPANFSLLLASTPAVGDTINALLASPSLMLGSMGYLTTVGTNLVEGRTLVAEAATTLITVTGQLYVAILIALVLARYHRRRA
ncbi:MAG: hypothetical protein FJ077_04825 [Cyanobacteria bacterium K_DeepCast_35m_m2_023]|nr:hypothetical protein [Cyanobacteria bacterium K_DeepCast_35m_m2_023]